MPPEQAIINRPGFKFIGVKKGFFLEISLEYEDKDNLYLLPI